MGLQHAIKLLSRAIELNPSQPRYRFARAWCYGVLTKNRAAVRDAVQAAEQLPQQSTSWVDLALVKLGTGDRAGALDALHKALELDSSDAFASTLRKDIVDSPVWERAVVCHRCHVPLTRDACHWIDLDRSDVRGHLYCGPCMESVYREAIGEAEVSVTSVAPRPPRGRPSNLFAWRLSKAQVEIAPSDFVRRKVGIRQEIVWKVRNQLQERHGSKEDWLAYCRGRGLWWWDEHGVRYT